LPSSRSGLRYHRHWPRRHRSVDSFRRLSTPKGALMPKY
jgi:hypothetical protein